MTEVSEVPKVKMLTDITEHGNYGLWMLLSFFVADIHVPYTYYLLHLNGGPLDPTARRPLAVSLTFDVVLGKRILEDFDLLSLLPSTTTAGDDVVVPQRCPPVE